MARRGNLGVDLFLLQNPSLPASEFLQMAFVVELQRSVAFHVVPRSHRIVSVECLLRWQGCERCSTPVLCIGMWSGFWTQSFSLPGPSIFVTVAA